MKRKSLILNLTWLLLTLAACRPNTGSNQEPKTAKGRQLSAGSDNKISMSINPNPIRISSGSKAMLTLTNNTSDSLKLGERFSIETFNGKEWKALKILDSVSVNDIGYIIPPGQAKELPINLSPKPFDYQPGRYRIGKLIQFMPGGRKLKLTAAFIMQ